MGDIHLKGSFNKIRVWSWELHLPQLPTFFLGEKHTSFFLATNKNLEQKKNISFRLWGPEKNMFLFRWLRGHSAAIRGMEAAANSL